MKSILIVRTDRIGDLILSTPAIATVRASFPGARITMICSPYNRVAVERNTDIDELVEAPAGVSAGRFGSRYRGRFDLAIALAPRIKDLTLTGATRAPVRVGYTYARRYLLRLFLRCYVNRCMISEADPELADRYPDRRVRHEVDQLLDLVALAGARRRVDRLRLDVTDDDRAAIAFLPESPIVFHLGKRWFMAGSTLESTLTLLRELRRFAHPVVVTYAPECEGNIAPIVHARVADVVAGGLTFHSWTAAFERARLIVTIDTGATHVASAVGRPTVVAFEHSYFSLNSQEWAPYGVPHELVRKPADETLESLTHFRGEVIDAVSRLLERTGG